MVCVPGGPLQASASLGDLGGLSAARPLVLLDLRGTGESAVPADPSSYRCDRLVDDVEALRAYLGLARVDLLGHSAGCSVAVMYAARHPGRVRRLALLTPSPRVVGIDVTDDDRREVAERRRGEPWFADAFAAFARIWSGTATDADWEAITPFTQGRWDAARAARLTQDAVGQDPAAVAAYYAPGIPDPQVTRAALASLGARVLVTAGEHDVALPPTRAAEYARLFPHGELAVQPGGGHHPWLDDPAWLARTLTAFLR
ncbi:hydrolase [Cellulomonas cellasea]|uniref:Hydrolase n=1 Tax=Cellulomonas cellasea TaxID=43670 RepID=A0A4Y3KXJ9_9CELL|nr:hydrolase [Cellulomonas cellasea]